MALSDSNPSSEPTELTLVIPLRNEAGELVPLIAEVQQVLDPIDITYAVLLVDDGSSDATWATIQALASEDRRVAGIQLSRNFGKEAALIAGLSEASGRAVLTMDGDGQHPPEKLPEFIEQWRSGADIVEGMKLSRTTQSFLGRQASKLFNRCFSRLSEIDLDEASDFRLLSRRAVDTLLSLPESAFFYRGLSSWIGFNRSRVTFVPAHRRGGRSSFSSWTLAKYAVKNTIAFTSAPLQLVTIAGFVFLFFALVLGAQTLWQWYAGRAVEGFTTVILLILIQGGVVMMALGLIGQYIAQIHNEVKGRPRFLIQASTRSEADARCKD